VESFAASWEVGARCRRLSWLLHASVVEAKHAELVRAFKAGFKPSQPRVPAGNPDGGQWMGSSGSGTSRSRSSSGEIENIPEERPESAQLRNVIIKEVAKRVVKLALQDAIGGPSGPILNAIEVASWIHEFAPYILAYADDPISLGELQDAVSAPAAGYDIHHIVEQTPAQQDGFDRALIDSPDNLVRIPTLKHWQITGWYTTRSKEFGGMTPRQYLRDKDWTERTRVGLKALIDHGVLKQ
jgi:hypothetical protein